MVHVQHWRVAHDFNTAVPGWLVLLPRRHVAAVHDLTNSEASALGVWQVKLSRALRSVTGCAKTCVVQFAEAEGFAHVHFHIIPRMADLQPEHRGPGVFELLRRPEHRRLVAWMPQHITPMPSLTAREYVAYVGWLKGMNCRDAWDKAAQALARVDLTDKANTKTTRVSGGQLRRVGVAAALVHDAQILLLDEPTAGMDPHQRRTFRDTLQTLTDDVRILMSTHDIADLAEEAHHVTVIDNGSILHTGTTQSFLAHTPPGSAPGRAAEASYTAWLNMKE